MKYYFSIILLCMCFTVYCQTREIDSLNVLIAHAKSDTARINLINAKIRPVGEINLDSAIALAAINIKSAINKNYAKGEADGRVKLANNLAYKGAYDSAKKNLFIAENIYKRINDSSGFMMLYSSYGILLAMQNQYQPSIKWLKRSIMYAERLRLPDRLETGYMNLAISYQMISDFGQSLTYYQKALKIAEQTNDVSNQAYTNLNIAITYESIGDTVHAEQAFLKSIEQAKSLKLNNVQAYAYSNLATLYSKKNKYNEAYNYSMKAYELSKAMGDVGMQASSLSRAAVQLSYLNQSDRAEAFAKRAIAVADSSHQSYNIYQTCTDAGSVFQRENKYQQAIAYYERGLSMLQKADLYDEQVGQSYFDLSGLYEQTGNYKKALEAFKKSSDITDSLTSKQNIRKATELTMNYDFGKKQQALKIEQQKKDAVTKTKQTALSIGLILTVLLAAVAFNGYRNKQKANRLLQQQKAKIESTLSELKTTQTQLIHSEKMASLGELTAGIAHEIQNPLNFVNNFSEVNNELIEELKDELVKQTAYIEEQHEALDNIFQNNEKIAFHGKRADAIVKNMLMHSRQTKSTKEPSDINALCDEYLRLSYHGLRAKDKSFNADFITDFDKSIGKINIVQQDIGRALLNFFNNAFYAVNEKQKVKRLTPNEQYKPVVSVQTKKLNDKVQIIINDNGTGIPQHIMDKIFQPFFTTKPTGQGTGLGLSLVYDIITKEHNGAVKAESKEGTGTSFIINLNYN